jgi:hypothetical protein
VYGLSTPSPGSPLQARVGRIWKQLSAVGYASCTDKDLGMESELREHILDRYYNDALRSSLPRVRDVPTDRERVRDVVRYAWTGPVLGLAEHDTTALINRGDQPGVRQYHRIMALDDPILKGWIEILISLVPPDFRRASGTCGFNLMRTRTLVVTKPHRDDEDFVITYVLARVGEGAESQLFDPEAKKVVSAIQLEPGQLLIFDDRRFLHSVTPLSPQSDMPTCRDALICTIA